MGHPRDTLAVNIIAFKLAPTRQAAVPSAHGAVPVAHASDRDTGALVSFFLFFFVLGVQSIGRSFPVYLLNGPWYLTWLTSFVGLALLYLSGMWFGIVYQRWGPFGTIAFIAAQVIAVLAAVLVVASTGVGHLFTGLTAAGLTGLLAVLAVALLAGGHATIRRATI